VFVAFPATAAVEFDSSTRNVLRYADRVPPMLRTGGKLQALDARVDYTTKLAAYRRDARQCENPRGIAPRSSGRRSRAERTFDRPW
jgi:hypothetical protein